MEFQTAISTCFKKYFVFEGRASRPEFWWFTLFVVAVNGFQSIFFGDDGISSVIWLALLVPTIAVYVRRLHDVGRRGYWAFFMFIPIVALILALLWLTKEGEKGGNQFGHDPLGKHKHRRKHKKSYSDDDDDEEDDDHDYDDDDDDDDDDGEDDEKWREQNQRDKSDNPWVKVREKNKRKNQNQNKVIKAAKSKAPEAPKAPDEPAKKSNQPPKFGRDAAKRRD